MLAKNKDLCYNYIMEVNHYNNKLMETRIEKWKEKLLDLSKRNRLLNYKPLSVSSLLVEEGFDGFIESFIERERPLIFLAPENKLSSILEDDESYENIENKKREKQHKSLRSIAKKISFAREEYGYNVGYIAYGFLNWVESEESDKTIKSPIILIPVTVEQNDRFSAFIVKYKTDEDVQLNPTIVEKLKMDFGFEINIDEFSDISTENGAKKVMKAFEDKIKNKEGWSLEKTTYIDTFNFQKMVILHDLNENVNLVFENRFASTLASGTNDKSKPFASNEPIDLDKQKSKDKLEILDADSSQEEAIYRARKGESFVIQGPPGTGKSQTITNIIAGALYDGKSILFVSEKQAALDVVYEKLRRANLSAFCLKMHDQRQSKNDIREQLKASIDLSENKQKISSSTMNIYDRLDRAQLKLNSYNELLHKPIEPLNKTPYELIGWLEKDKAQIELRNSVPLNDESTTIRMFDDLKQYVQTFNTLSDEFTTSGWNNYRGENTTDGFQKLREQSENIKKVYTQYEQQKRKMGELIQSTRLNWTDSYEAFNKIYKKLDVYDKYQYVNETWGNLEEKEVKEIKSYIKQLKRLFTQYNKTHDELFDLVSKQQQIKSDIAKFFDSGIFNRSKEMIKMIPTFENKYKSGARWIDINYHHDMKTLFSLSKGKVEKSYDNALLVLKKLRKDLELKEKIKDCTKQKETIIHEIEDYYDSAPSLNSLTVLIKKYRKINYSSEKYNSEPLDMVNNSLDYCMALRNIIGNNFILAEGILPDILQNGLNSRLAKTVYAMNQTMETTEKAFADSYLHIDNSTLVGRCEKIEGWMRQYQNFDWSMQQNYESHALVRASIEKEYKIKDLLDEIESLHILKQDIVPAIKRRMYLQYLEKAELRSQYVKEYNRNLHDQIISDFVKYDEGQRKIAAERIRCKLINDIPDFSGFSTTINSVSEISFLRREVNKKSRLVPTRKLIAKTPTILPKLKPCVMMSPITVSSYYASNPTMKFDLVIFDEASQVKPETAIASVMRAKQLIIAGDSKQMPPTSFFDTMIDDDDQEFDDEKEDEITDLESVLDEFKTTLPQISLKWHYRSRDESLIAFSNRRFYEKKLYTFPSIYRNNEDVGVKFNYVEDGIWERRSGNLAEAQRVAILVFEHIKNHPDESLGVVAFGKSQSNAIEDAVNKMRDMNPGYEEFFNENKDEPFFIKNLENVQGDERDAIILSVGYAKSPDGSFRMAFGPVAAEGGERRLNVAISRSKKRMTVVCSFHAREIRDDGKNPNRKILRDFIDFAENGKIELISGDELESDETKFDSLFEKEVYNYIISKGYLAKTQIGVSGYKIDMAIIDPNNTNRYVLAIECDGAYYHSSRTARDRDRLRQSVLEAMGWQFYRIWSTDWFYNQTVEKRKLINAIERVLSGKHINKVNEEITIEIEPDDREKIIEKELSNIRKTFATYTPSSNWYSFSSGYYSCTSVEGWEKAVRIAMKTNYSGMSKEDFARYVVKKFLLREKLSGDSKMYCIRAINNLIKNGELKESKDNILIKE